jgi:hypothetical protein
VISDGATRMQEMHAEYASMLAYLLAARAEGDRWLQGLQAARVAMEALALDLEGLLYAHGLLIEPLEARHPLTVRPAHPMHACMHACTPQLYQHDPCQTIPCMHAHHSCYMT